MAGWDIVYLQLDDGSVPGAGFLDACPDRVEAKIVAVLDAVAAAPPPSFSGGGFWEAMHGTMAGYYEVRVPGPGQRLYRLFCLLDRSGPGLPRPAIAVITGMVKPNRTTFTERQYRAVRAFGDVYLKSDPRSIAK
jgi:hypothetical protein